MKRVALYENIGKPDALIYAKMMVAILRKLDVNCIVRESLYKHLDEDLQKFVHKLEVMDFEKFADFIVTFGGDGTILSAARDTLHSGMPIMGVNVGKLGFLAEYPVENMESSIKEVLDGNYRLVDRAVLETQINGKVIYALNDFVIEKKDTSKMITLQTFSDDNYVGDYRADGLILTTPTGSTAYSLSCNGPIIAPSTQVVCITPISPHTLTLRPLVIPDTNEIVFKLISDSTALLVADGKNVGIIGNGDVVRVNLSSSRVKLIKPQKSSYYDVLRKKLLWAASGIEQNDME